VLERGGVAAGAMADGQGTADPLELEHMIGYTGEGAQSIQYHPTERDTLVGYIGRLVLIANVHDKHQQEFLHGHNEEVTSLAVSPSGNLIASGQGSSRCVPNSEAMVIVWDWKTRQSIYRLIELNDGIAFSRNSVTHLAFSGDDRFLAGTDDQPGNTKLAVWDMESGQVA
jgi:cilia- and flagella-associated protein 52